MLRYGIRIAFWLEMVLMFVLEMIGFFLWGFLEALGVKIVEYLEQLWLERKYKKIQEERRAKRHGNNAKKKRR